MAPDALPPDAPPLYWRGDDESDPRIVGQSTDAHFAIDDAGAVWLVPDGSSPRLFVNTTREYFYESMAVFQRAWTSLGQDDDATSTVERIAKALTSIDAEALSDGGGFGPVVLEQVQDGLL